MSSSHRDPTERAVAVVGLGAILPDALDVRTFWQNVISGRDSVSEVSADRWDPALYYDPDPKAVDKTYSKIGGWVRGFRFDPVRYRIPPKVAQEMDEGQHWAVAAAAEALKDAGHPDRPLDLEKTGVILGNAMGGERHYITASRLFAPEFQQALQGSGTFAALPASTRQAILGEFVDVVRSRLPETTEDTMPGELANITAGRVAAVFNLRGPNFTTDAACASSLAALQAAIDGLVDHHYDAVLTGGMDRNMGASTYIKFCKIGALSADGSRPYAKGANGFVMGEGGALFLLKRVEDAEKAGDRIYAIIRAVGASSDGKGKGITAPNPVGQVLAIRRAWERAGLSPETVGLVEGHGTSTAVGDVAEVSAIASVLESARLPARSIALGSIKSQIGHLKAGAGAAGLLKAVLAVHHKVLPPSIHYAEPNPYIGIERTPFFVPTTPQPWERRADSPRRAALSAFGFGGTNFHVVLEEHVPGALSTRRPMISVPAAFESGANGANGANGVGAGPKAAADAKPLGDLLALGAPTVDALRDALSLAVDRARRGDAPPRRVPGGDVLAAPERIVIAFESTADFVRLGESALGLFAKKADARSWRLLQAKGVHRGSGQPGKVAFLYPGQGSQYVNMLGKLRALEPVVAETFAEADAVMKPILGRPLTDFLFVDPGDAANMAQAEERLRETVITQPAVLTCNVALTRLLAQFGIVPDLVMGHSLGEWAAVVAAGMLPFADALVAVSSRARGMASVAPPDPGKMASVLGPYEEVVRRLASVPGYVVAANLNSKNQTVIAGETEAVLRAIEDFKGAGYTAQLIPVSHAFHSRIVAAASGPLHKVLESVPMRTPAIPVVGNVHGELYPADLEQIRDLLSIQLASPVQWMKSLETAYREGARVFVEVGPKRVLRGLAEDMFSEREGVTCLSTNHPKRGDVASFHDGLCGLLAAGIPRPSSRSPSHASDTFELKTPSAPRPSAMSQHAPTPPSAAAPSPAFVSSSAPAPTGAPDYFALGRLLARFLDEGFSLYHGAPSAAAPPGPQGALSSAPSITGGAPLAGTGSVVVSGAGIGLPGKSHRVFEDNGIERILGGDVLIDPVAERDRERMVEKNIVRLVKREIGEPSLDPIRSTTEVLKLAAQKGAFDLVREFGVEPEREEAFDVTTSLAIAAGIEALRDARIPLVRRYRHTTTGSRLPDRWLLPRGLADETGVIFSSAFPAQNALVDEVERFHEDRLRRMIADELARYASDNPRARQRIADLEAEVRANRYVFSRKLLFKALAMGHSQFAELLGARGPNTLINSACASATQAVGIAYDWIRLGRCRRVLIITADDSTSERLFQWIGSGFLASGAATTEERLELAALPFDRRRNGTIVGMGAAALVVEAQDAIAERGMRGLSEVLWTESANSAFHGTRLDVEHIGEAMERVITTAERIHQVRRDTMAREMIFMSHETYTPARGGSAAAEVNALRKVFGADADRIVIANTKGFTGHPMGVAVEDVVAVKALEKQVVPPVPNFREPDPELGPLNLSRGGHYPIRYALRFAAGFGSQLSITLSRRVPGCEERVADRRAYEQWLANVSGYSVATLEVVHRTLRIRDQGAPEREPGASTWTRDAGPVLRVLPLPSEDTAPLPASLFSGQARPAEPRPSSPPMASVSRPSPAPSKAVVQDPVVERVLGLVSDKTGYPRDMLDLELDLEADLGVDTVKQAEVFALVRDAFEIPRQDNIKLRDYPTLGHVIGFVRTNRPDLAQAPAAPTSTPVVASPPAPPTDPAVTLSAAGPAGARPTSDPVTERVLGLVSDKTGYPRDMLDLELDLEADLGVDTVKQAEVFALVRDAFEIPRQDNIKLRDYPTLGHVIGFVRTNRPDLAQAPAAPTSTPVVASPSAPPTDPTVTPSTAGPAGARPTSDPVTERVLGLVSDKTGYPRDMLDLELDLEADLGVDTVKQAEVFALVRETFEIPRQDDIKLRDYPTLAHVIGFVRTNRPDLALATRPTANAPAAPASETEREAATQSEGPSPSAAPVRRDPITAAVLAVVSEKTGYPSDMLELELDLEADLGIDTVKQAEVLAEVRARFDIPRQDDLKLRDYPTLAHVIGFVRDHAKPMPADSSRAPNGVEAREPREAPADQSRDLLRAPVPVVCAPLELCKPTGARIEGNRVLIVADEGGAATALADEVQRAGGHPTVLTGIATAEEARTRTVEWIGAGSVGGAFFLSALDPTPNLSDLEPDAFRAVDERQVKALCAVTRGLYESLANPSAFLVTATRLGGLHGHERAGATSPIGGAVAGFTKCIARERPNAVVKVVDFSVDAEAENIARALLQEVERDPDPVEVGHREGTRYTIGAVPLDEAPHSPSAPMKLDAASVVVVTGGAGGITSAIVLDLARASKATFHLFGRSPAPDDATRRDLERMRTDREGLKRDIFDRLKAEAGRATPAQVESKLLELERGQSILDTLEGVKAAGGKAFYQSLDVKDLEAVSSALEAVRRESGAIDVLVHGAGVERSRRFDAKSQDEFDRVYGVKVFGLYNLLRATREAPPKALVCFSSVAGRFGNHGQADYGAGNDFLCKASAWFRARYPESIALTLDWSAWGGIGMATRGSIPEMMRRAGIEMLDPNEATPLVRTGLARGLSAEIVVGRRLGVLLEPRDREGGIDRDALGRLAQTGGRGLVLEPVGYNKNTGLEIAVTLDPQREPFLHDHQIEGTPVLPGVMGLEAFAEASCLLAPGYEVRQVEDVRFLAPLKYYRNEARTAVVRALPMRGPDGSLRVACSLTSSQILTGGQTQDKLHFVATIVLAKRTAEETELRVAQSVDGVGASIGRDAIYRVYFHGPAYQVLESVERLADGSVAGKLAGSLPVDRSNPDKHWALVPRLVELCFQTAGVYEIGSSGQMGLPSVAERVRVHAQPPRDVPLIARVRPSARRTSGVGGVLGFDAAIVDESGRVYVELEGYRTSLLPGAIPGAELAPFRTVAPPASATP